MFLVVPLKQLMSWALHVEFGHYRYHQHEGSNHVKRSLS